MRQDLLILIAVMLGVAIFLLNPILPSEPLSFTTIQKGVESDIKTRTRLVIKDEKSWHALWDKHISYRDKLVEEPVVDFSNYMVIAVFGGIEPSGYVLQIERIEKREKKVVVIYSVGPTHQNNSCRKCNLPTGMYEPYHIVKLKKLDLPVVFRSY